MQQVGSSKVKIVLNFDEYSPVLYRNDFKDFLDYQTGREASNPQLERQFDLKKIFSREFAAIPYNGLAKHLSNHYSYDFFKQTVSMFLERIVVVVLRDFPNIATAHEFEIQIKISRVPRREYYGAYDTEISDNQRAYIELAGIWLLTNIAMPWAIHKRINYVIVEKFLVQELHHHIDNVAKAFAYEQRLEEKLQLRSRKISNYGLLYLYSALMELRSYGFSEFAARRYTRFDIKRGIITNFKHDLRHIISLRRRNEAREFFEKRLSTESYVTYYCGMIMCLFIALEIALRNRQKPVAVVGSQQYPIGQLNSLLDKGDASVENLSKEAFSSALEVIPSMNPVDFLNAYNKACDLLGLSNEHRVIWWRMFRDISREAIHVYREEQAVKARSRGYRP